MEIAELGLSDRGRLLVLLNAASRGRLTMYREPLASYVWLINAYRVLPFYYPFGMNPLPYSSELSECLDISIRAGEVGSGSHAWITPDDAKWVSENIEKPLDFKEVKKRLLKEYVYIIPEGKEWVSKKVGIASDFEEVSENLIKHLKLFVNWNKNQLFQEVYNAITKPEETRMLIA